MRTMYDSVTPTDIPIDAQLIAGYIDGVPRWPAAGWKRFWHAAHVSIALDPATDAGDVLDVEQGSARPDQAPGWVQRRRAVGDTPTVYCNQALWPTVRAEFARAGVAEPLWWIAAWTGRAPATLPPGVIAIQYASPETGSGGHWDLSAVADYWPGVDGPQLDGEQDMAGFWFVNNSDTGERALLYPNGDFVGMEGVDTTGVVSANNVPVLDVPQAKFDEMAGRLSSRLKEAADQTAAAFRPAGGGDQGDAGTVPVDIQIDGQHWTGNLTPPAGPAASSGVVEPTQG